jgi:hypothetical protein
LNFNLKSTSELREVPVQPQRDNLKTTQPSQGAPGTEDSCSKSWARFYTPVGGTCDGLPVAWDSAGR